MSNHRADSGTKLTDITDKLHAAFKRHKEDVIEIGRLLRAAKKELGHGAFLPWLKSEFCLSERSAQRYMAVHQFFVESVEPVAKSDKLADLKLRPSALSALQSLHSQRELPTEVLERVVSESRERWIGKTDVEGMLGIPRAGTGAEGQAPAATPSNNADCEEEEEASNGAEAKAAKGADAKVPTAEPSNTSESNAEEVASGMQSAEPESSSTQHGGAQALPDATGEAHGQQARHVDRSNGASMDLAGFNDCVMKLKQLAAQTVERYAVASVSIDDLNTAADFLQRVVACKKQVENGARAEQRDGEQRAA
jgi:hypothetical protein